MDGNSPFMHFPSPRLPIPELKYSVTCEVAENFRSGVSIPPSTRGVVHSSLKFPDYETQV